MSTYLILANQTLSGARLVEAVRDRIAQDHEARFHVVVPATLPDDQVAAWATDSLAYGYASFDALDQARKIAEERLERIKVRIEQEGATAAGEVGVEDPTEAVGDALAARSFDEIIVSTLPGRISRWLKLDVPSRIARMTDTPVTTIEAEERTTAG